MRQRQGMANGLKLVGVLAVVVMGCGVEPLPEDEIQSTLNTSTAALNACQAACQQELMLCTQGCRGIPPTQDGDCRSDCSYDYYWCTAGSWVIQSQGNTICHMDTDDHIISVDVELYVADTYRDVSGCNEENRYKKRRIATVSCSPFSGEWSSSACKSKVANKIAQLASQGYVPGVSVPDQDTCPTPRL